ncbi:MAG: putative molybdenum carrier protein [Candidatus Riflebacteria bacterium]|nr:putative molybdenum carrier protein [Candidatus Riflebacteria bacterium]
MLKIVSGGQTGVDRAALDVALELGIPIGGWCPLGRIAEDGTIPPEYTLIETSSKKYPIRTRFNVRDSDATLVFSEGPLRGGSALTIEFAKRERKPFLHVDSSFHEIAGAVETVYVWLLKEKPGILNVAGPRLSEAPKVAKFAKSVLRLVLI